MASTIDQHFITQFESEVKLAYQQMGSKLRGLVRLKTGVTGSTVRFPKLGRGSAQQKARNGDVPVMNATASYADATMSDWYAAEYVDKLDELKTNVEERQALVQAEAAALGRKVDNLVITALPSGIATGQNITSSFTGLGSTRFNLAYANGVFKKLNDNDVQDDGGRVVLVGPQQWNDMLTNISQFTSADYVGPDTLPFLSGTQAKKWLNMLWVLHTGLNTATSTASRICLAFHKAAIGLGENQSVMTDIDWVPTKSAYLVNSVLSAGAVRIEDEGVVRFDVQDS